MNQADNTILTITISGPAVDDHHIDIGVLTKCIAGLELLLKSSSEIYSPSSPIISVELVAGFDEGSFKYSISAVWEWLDSKTAKRLATLGGLIGLAMGAADGMSALEILKCSPSNPVQYSIEYQEDGAVITIGKQKLRTNATVIELLKNKKVRKGIDDFTSPLSEDGIESMNSSLNGNEFPIGSKRERNHFKRDFYLFTNTAESNAREAWLEIVSPVFQKDGLWKVREKDIDHPNKKSKLVTATMKDREFLTEVISKSTAIRPGDVIYADIFERFLSSRNKDRIKRIDILQVNSHIKRHEFNGIAARNNNL